MAASRRSCESSVRHLPAASPPELTREDWELILQALDVYRHHAAFRAVHDKIAARRSTPRQLPHASEAQATH